MNPPVRADEFDEARIIRNVLVVGFHHKKGAMIDYAYPPLAGCDSNEVPELWRHMPSLAIPDGAHNYEWDIVYFHLPSLDEPRKTLFCISCYRQIRAENVKNPSKDITRSTVQKAICVISKLPLFGHIRVHVWEVADHFMKGGDFSDTSEFSKLFRNLNLRITPEMLRTPELFFGLKVVDLLLRFRHRLLVLLKCILLEKRILFVHSPVHSLSSSILALLSLLPRMLETGLDEATHVPEGDYSTLPPVNSERRSREVRDAAEAHRTPRLDLELLEAVDLKEAGFPFPIFGCGNICHPYLALPYVDLLASVNVRGFLVGATNILFKQKRHLSDVIVELDGGKVEILDSELKRSSSLSTEDSRFMDYLVRRVTECGDGEILPDATCSSGCKRQGADDWVRRAFWLYFVRLASTVDADSVSTDGTELDRVSDSFHPAFVASWRETRNFQIWDGADKRIPMSDVRHPFAGGVSMSDMKIKLAQISHNMQSTERGKKLNESLVVTGKAVAQTGKVVGGAIGSARGFISNLWTGFSANRSLQNSDPDEPNRNEST